MTGGGLTGGLTSVTAVLHLKKKPTTKKTSFGEAERVTLHDGDSDDVTLRYPEGERTFDLHPPTKCSASTPADGVSAHAAAAASHRQSKVMQTDEGEGSCTVGGIGSDHRQVSHAVTSL